MITTKLGHGRGWLAAAPAASILRIDRQLGHPLQITEAGRTRERQQYLRDGWLKRLPGFFYAAPVEESPHPRGDAVDSDEAQSHLGVMAEHGWYRPLPSEPWHFLYRPSRDKHLNDPTPKPALPEEADEEMSSMKGAVYTRASDKQLVFLLFNESSGFYVEHAGVGGDYNNALARNWDTNSWPSITESHATVIKRSLDAVRRTALTGSVSVDIVEP